MSLDSLIMLFYMIIGSFVINIITLILVIVLLVKNKKVVKQSVEPTVQMAQSGGQMPPESGVGVVFCRNCGNQYAANHSTCPHCETSR